jgi:CBS domain-containing protein
LAIYQKENAVVQPKLARDIMVTKLVTLPPEMHVFDGIAGLVKQKISGAPVVDPQRNFLGVFSEKCCMNVLGVMARYAQEKGKEVSVHAKEFMVSKLVTLTPDMDVFDAIGLLLRKRISGAPVLDSSGKFLGVFSEKNSMQVLISAAYDQLPTTRVEAFVNKDMNRVIDDDAELVNVAQVFVDTPYRRLEVVRDGKLLGQISRRDVLHAEQKVSMPARDRDEALAELFASDNSASVDGESSEPSNHATHVSRYMDRVAKTITEDIDFLKIARIFLDTPYRRLPVVNDGKLVGQISRRDVLQVANKLIDIDPPPRKKTLLYLSALVGREDAPFE